MLNFWRRMGMSKFIRFLITIRFIPVESVNLSENISFRYCSARTFSFIVINRHQMSHCVRNLWDFGKWKLDFTNIFSYCLYVSNSVLHHCTYLSSPLSPLYPPYIWLLLIFLFSLIVETSKERLFLPFDKPTLCVC